MWTFPGWAIFSVPLSLSFQENFLPPGPVISGTEKSPGPCPVFRSLVSKGLLSPGSLRSSLGPISSPFILCLYLAFLDFFFKYGLFIYMCEITVSFCSGCPSSATATTVICLSLSPHVQGVPAHSGIKRSIFSLIQLLPSFQRCCLHASFCLFLHQCHFIVRTVLYSQKIRCFYVKEKNFKVHLKYYYNALGREFFYL